MQRLSRLELVSIERDVQSWDQQAFKTIISTELCPDQITKIITVPHSYPQQEDVLAIHWHPEYIPMDLIYQRYHATFPNLKHDLFIPTQHNSIVTAGDYCGVEVDCYAPEFRSKIQILLHFELSKLSKTDALVGMLNHTFRYRSSQLFEFIDTVINPKLEHRVIEAAMQSGTSDEMIEFSRIYIHKLFMLLEQNSATTPVDAHKNRLVFDYFDQLRQHYDDHIIDRAEIFLVNVKKLVKKNFSMKYFYLVHDIIEEARNIGAGIVIPHPEQFWPILLADYDVDGYEVWNPQSSEYTEFLINVVNRQNRSRPHGQDHLLVFMGDDTHMSSKIKKPNSMDVEKAKREIGVQPAWDDLDIKKSLLMGGFEKQTIIQEYKNRLHS